MAKIIIAIVVILIFLVGIGLTIFFTVKKSNKKSKKIDPITPEQPKEEKKDPKPESPITKTAVTIQEQLLKEDVPIINEISLNVSDDKKTVIVNNFYENVKNDIFLTVFDGENDMPIYKWDKFEPLTRYTVKVPVEQFTSIGNTLTFNKIQYRITDSYIKQLNK